MATTEFSAAINQLAAERGISVEAVLETVKQALVAAYLKDFSDRPLAETDEEGIEIRLDLETGDVRVFKEGKDVTPRGFGRIAAQTAKQVILQRIREEEKLAVRGEFEKKIGSIISGQIFRVEKGVAFVDLGRVQGVLPPSEQIPDEEYRIGQRVKALVKEIREGPRGPEVLLSRADAGLVKELFALEVPEIPAGVVKIEAVAREPGRRTKMAVSSSEEKVDPVGSCVGQKGVRVQAVTRELGEEKVDVILYSPDPVTFVGAALSPAKVVHVNLKKKSSTAEVEVPEDQLSLAIGSGGQNVRLAAKLTGWRIDIKGAGEVFAAETAKMESGKGGELEQLGLSKRTVGVLAKAEVTTLDQLRSKSAEEMKAIKGLGAKSLEEIKKALEKSGGSASEERPVGSDQGEGKVEGGEGSEQGNKGVTDEEKSDKEEK